MSFYNLNVEDIENASKVQITKKFNIRIFFKIPIGVEIRVDDHHFVSWSLSQKILFLWRNFRLEQGATTSQNTLK